MTKWATRYPTMSIVLPALLFFILSYPFLSGNSSGTHSSNLYMSKIDFELLPSDTPTDLSLIQILIKLDDGGDVLKKGTLLESLAFQNRLLENLTGSTNIASIQSPFEIWNNSLPTLQMDDSPLKSINLQLRHLPKYLLRRVMKVNGYVTSAEGLTISLLVKDQDRGGFQMILDNNIATMNSISNITNFHILPSLVEPANISEKEVLKFTLMHLTWWDVSLFIVAYLLMFACFFWNFASIPTVKSKVGISIAAVFEILLSLGSSLTLTNLVFKTSSEIVPGFLMYLPVLIISFGGIRQLLEHTAGSSVADLNSSSDTQETNRVEDYAEPKQRSFIFASAECNVSFFYTTILSVLIVAFVIPFNRKVSFFIACSLSVNWILQTFYFTAIISLDYRRLSSNDVLFMTDNDRKYKVSLDDKVASKDVSRVLISENLERITNVIAAYSPLLILTYFLYLTQRFYPVRSSSSLIHKVFHGKFNSLSYFAKGQSSILADQKSIASLIMNIYGSGSYFLNLAPYDQIHVVKQNYPCSSNLISDTRDLFYSSIVSSYKFDFYYFFEFVVLIILLVASALLLLQLLLQNVDNEDNRAQNGVRKSQHRDNYNQEGPVTSSKEDDTAAFHIKELSAGGHTLDIIKISTSQSPFILSVGLDRKVLVWSPLSKPVPPPTEIPLARKYWPIAEVVISNDGNYTAFFSQSGKVTCWSRKRMEFIWSHVLDNVNNVPVECFFRKRTVPAFMKRRTENVGSELNRKLNGSLDRPLSRSRRDSNVSIASIRSTTSISTVKNGPVDALYENTTLATSGEDDLLEFVFVTSDGRMNIVNSRGELNNSKLTTSEHRLISCKRLITPRVNDRLVIFDQVGDIYISTVVNNKWRSRKLIVQRNRFNKGKMLMTPAALSRGVFENTDEIGTNVENTILPGEVSLSLIPFVGMILLAKGTEAELIDAQTGTSIKKFELGEYKSGSLKVFHDQPTHCRFCGSASVASFSIAYTAKLNSTLVMHSFQLESRTKTSICLRVERDPREIRCLGFEAVVEKKYYLPNVDGWNFTENNMIIGIRRKDDRIESKAGSSSMMRSSSEESGATLSKLQSRVKSKRMNTSRSVDYNIHNIWEGWTMTTDGRISFHKIPTGVNGLLVNKIGPLEKFGAKSIVVTFGNIMKMFYLGHEELILSPDDVSSNEVDTGLKFINRRRDRLTNKKISTNYNKF